MASASAVSKKVHIATALTAVNFPNSRTRFPGLGERRGPGYNLVGWLSRRSSRAARRLYTKMVGEGERPQPCRLLDAWTPRNIHHLRFGIWSR